MDEQSAAAAVETDAAQVDWKGRALTAEARCVELEGQLRVIAVVVGEFYPSR